jgi:hypothetical protein
MADNNTGLNAQYDHASPLFPGGGSFDSTGAPGGQGDTAAETSGSVIGSPAVSTPYASSQIPGNMPHLDVTSGDTSGMSSDSPVGDNFSEISGRPASAFLSTGAGQGDPNPYRGSHAGGRS